MKPIAPFLILLLNWSIDSTDPEVQKTIKYFFVAIHLVIIAVNIYIFARAWQSVDDARVTVKDNITKEVQEMSASNYDVGKVRDLAIFQIGIPAAISLYIANNWGVAFPLILQCINNPLTTYNSELFQIYIKGAPIEGPLVRPWKETSALPDWLQKIWNTDDDNKDNNNTSGTQRPSQKK